MTEAATPPTIFARIVRGEVPCSKVYEDDICLAFHDVAPVAPVHVLIIPKEPVESLGHIDGSHEAMLGHLLRKAGEIGTQLCPDGFRVVTNTGADGGQTVAHLHLHILGGRAMAWPPG